MRRATKLLAAGIAALIVVLALVHVAGAKGTLEVSPATVTQGSTFTLSGCGYPAPTAIVFKVVGPGTEYFTAAEPLADPCFEETWTAWWGEPGRYSITSYYRDAKGALHKVAVVKFTVQ